MTLFEISCVCVSYFLTMSKDTAVKDAKIMFSRKQSSKLSDHLVVVFSESTVDTIFTMVFILSTVTFTSRNVVFTLLHPVSSYLHLVKCCFHFASAGVQCSECSVRFSHPGSGFYIVSFSLIHYQRLKYNYIRCKQTYKHTCVTSK